jgi:hypothetical protein
MTRESAVDEPIHRATVGRDIRAAFASAATRPAPPLVRADLGDPHYGGIEAKLELHPGQPTVEFLEQLTREANALQPMAERWFWRSLLLAVVETMEDPHHEAMALFRTVRALTPDPIAVLKGRSDYDPDDAQVLRERFTPRPSARARAPTSGLWPMTPRTRRSSASSRTPSQTRRRPPGR